MKEIFFVSFHAYKQNIIQLIYIKPQNLNNGVWAGGLFVWKNLKKKFKKIL